MKISLPLNEVDVKILKTLEAEGAKTSTRDLGKTLDIPDRTIRYRLKRMREKGILQSPLMQTYERKLGLAEKLIFIRSIPNKEAKLKKIFEEIPVIYHYASTYGRYEGFVVYSMFPIEEASIIESILKAMKMSGLIKEYYVFELVDYVRKGANVDTFLPDSKWEWDRWYNEIDEIMDECEQFELGFEQSPKMTEFDFDDVQILMNMVENAEITQKEISETLDISPIEVHKRIKHLEENGVIRGYKPAFMAFKEGTYFTIIFKSREHAHKILCAFHRLPFYVTFAQESKDTYYITTSVPHGENACFLDGINRLKPYLEDIFVQTTLSHKHKGQLHLLSKYNQENQQWDIPVNQYLELIQKISESE